MKALAGDCAAGAALATHFEAGLGSIARGAALGGMSAASLERAASDFEERGWLTVSNGRWCQSSVSMPPGLGAFLSGAATMKDALAADAETMAVVTLPNAPSAIARALPAEGPIHASIGRTNEAIESIAQSALTSLTIMSPFVNREGAEFILRMFDQSQAGQRTLITRR